MLQKAKSGRDAFTFSLDGMKAVASFTFVPAIAPERINSGIAARLDCSGQRGPGFTRRFEDFLGRYYAPGHCVAV